MYDEYLSQCDELPDRQYEKMKYIFNIIKPGLGEAIVEDMESFEIAYSELKEDQKTRFVNTLLTEHIITFTNQMVLKK